MVQQRPLPRPTSPLLQGFSPVLHLIGLSSFAYSFKWLQDNHTPIDESYGWHFQYLTILGLTIGTLAFVCGILADLTSSSTLYYAKNTLSMCGTPLEVLVSILYWTIRSYDKNLVIPEWTQLPLQADISFHAIPSIVLTLDFLFLSPPWTISTGGAMALSTTLAFSYWFWIEQCFKHNGYYPYPIFEVVGTAGRVELFILSAAVMTASTVMLKGLYSKVNGDPGSGESKALDEGSIPEKFTAFTKEAGYIVTGRDGVGEKESGVAMDESSIQEQAKAYVQEGKYIVKAQI